VAPALEMYAQRWTSEDEDLLVENLELGYDLEVIASVLGRTPYAVAMKVVHLTTKGHLVIMGQGTFDALVRVSYQGTD
jgi:hypothetical protein